ncbi:RluA family pseudouridine synthase [Breznakiella homolactica]|uniref:RluA family pseudouridine synthase n=2 Tax=Breznakiella homolactica TaxID=2798577 RepID=A0A7T7XS06_9SPIR|nr:RluA family pseudouridine synthase [Breznakiella homolactica]
MLPGRLELLYEDRDLMVVNKPAGLLSVATSSERDRTVYWILSEYLRKKGEQRRPAAVHRLDRDTSGVMVWAKSGRIKQHLMERWNESVRERRYVALAEGRIAEEQGTINAPVGEISESRMTVTSTGSPAVTHWKTIRSGDFYTLLSLELGTGRRNQIRVHLSHIGNPIAGDAKYGAKTNPVGRLALHAESLVICHPRNGTVMRFSVPAPDSFVTAVKSSGPKKRH